MLKRFFETYIGKTLSRSKVLPKPYQEPFGGSLRRVFGKRFDAIVLDVVNDEVKVNVVSQKLAPGGEPVDNLQDEHGDLSVPLQNLEGLEDFWASVITESDPIFKEAESGPTGS